MCVCVCYDETKIVLNFQNKYNLVRYTIKLLCPVFQYSDSHCVLILNSRRFFFCVYVFVMEECENGFCAEGAKAAKCLPKIFQAFVLSKDQGNKCMGEMTTNKHFYSVNRFFFSSNKNVWFSFPSKIKLQKIKMQNL